MRLNLLELEGRDVPAWWAVSLPTPPEGVAGVTDATHTGALEFSPDYVPAGGVVTVAAATAQQAAVKALTGTITVELGGETTDYTFGPDAVSDDANDGMPFVAVQNGPTVLIHFEDMAGSDGCDWDYNDRDFPGVSVSKAAVPIVHEEYYLSPLKTDANGVEYNDGSINLKVTQKESGDLLWTYDLTNIRFYQHDEDDGHPIHEFYVGFPAHTPVTEVTDSMGWGYSLSEEFGNETTSVLWGSDPTYWDGLFPDDTATFSFTTPVVPIVEGGVIAGELSGERIITQMAAPGEVFKAKLESVTFSGGNRFDIKEDPGDPVIKAAPHWLDENRNFIIDVGSNDRALPVGYVRNDLVKVSAKFKVTPGTAPGGFVLVRAVGSGKYHMPWTLAPVVGGEVRLPATALSKALDNKVDYIPEFKFKWEVCALRLGWPIKTHAGDSKNEFFVTLAAPAPPAGHGVYVTPLWLFCKEAKGSTTKEQAVPKAFAAFEGKAVQTHKSLDPNRVDPPVPLHYYKEWGNTNRTITALLQDTVIGNMRFKDGQCDSFADLFRHELLVGGVAQTEISKFRVRVAGAVGNSVLFIKEWEFATVGTPSPPGTHTNVYRNPPLSAPTPQYDVNNLVAVRDAQGSWSYVWGAAPEVEDKSGIKGQNNTNPQSIFSDHALVWIGGTLYDPSYGTKFAGAAAGGPDAWRAAQQPWEDASLAGLGRTFSYTGADGKPYDRLAVSKQVVNAPDTVMLMEGW